MALGAGFGSFSAVAVRAPSPLLENATIRNLSKVGKKGRNATRVAPVLPECARGSNQMVKPRAVLPPWAQ